MPSDVANPPLIVILGPTAVGKTAASLALARRFQGEIVSADSRLFYRGMDIGTAKPTNEERAEVPHHLVDVANPDQVWSLAKFQRAAQQAIDDIRTRNRLPFLVGGSGQYLRAVFEGWEIPAKKPDQRMRSALDRWAEQVGPAGLHARLAVIDPQAAARIEPNNLRRTTRALEVIFGTGRLFSTQRRRRPVPFRTCLLGLTRPRAELFARIDARLNAMMAAGFLGEVSSLLAAGYSPDLPAFSAIGYRELIGHLRGEYSLDEALRLIKRRSRQFVRRQANWFKESDPNIHWIRAESGAVSSMVEVIARHL